MGIHCLSNHIKNQNFEEIWLSPFLHGATKTSRTVPRWSRSGVLRPRRHRARNLGCCAAARHALSPTPRSLDGAD